MARSERQRWVEVFRISEPSPDSAAGHARSQHQQAMAIIRAFAKVGRVVRVEPDANGYSSIVLKARRA